MKSDVTIIERLSEAAHSSDLSHRHTLCDADWLHGLGMAGQKHRQGSALMDLDLTLSPSAMAEAVKATIQITRRIAEKRGWSMHALKARRIATEAVRHYLKPTCGCCSGRGMVGIDRDKPGKAQRVRPCPECGGSGRRPLPKREQREIREVLYVMEEARRRVGGAVRRAMSSRADVE